MEGQALKALYSAAVASLEKYGVAVIDDLDLACAPRSVRRSRTLIGDIKGSGDLFNWEVAPTPARLLKALSDASNLSWWGHCVFISRRCSSCLHQGLGLVMKYEYTRNMRQSRYKDDTSILVLFVFYGLLMSDVICN